MTLIDVSAASMQPNDLSIEQLEAAIGGAACSPCGWFSFGHPPYVSSDTSVVLGHEPTHAR